MPKVHYIEYNGTEHVVEGESGKTLMQTAVDNLVPGIVGDCGGCCSCATCHGYVDPAWIARAGAPSENESMMLDGALARADNSRLTCQIVLTDALDGIVVRLPESQY